MLVLGVGILLIFSGLPVVVVGLLTFFLIYCQYANNISWNWLLFWVTPLKMLLVAVCSIVIIVILTLCFISSGLVAIFLLSGMYVVVSLSTYSCMSLGLLWYTLDSNYVWLGILPVMLCFLNVSVPVVGVAIISSLLMQLV